MTIKTKQTKGKLANMLKHLSTSTWLYQNGLIHTIAGLSKAGGVTKMHFSYIKMKSMKYRVVI